MYTFNTVVKKSDKAIRQAKQLKDINIEVK